MLQISTVHQRMIPWSYSPCKPQNGEYISISDDRALLGRVLETFIMGQLRKQLSWAAPQLSFYDFRTGIVLYLGHRVIPFGEKLWLVPVQALLTP